MDNSQIVYNFYKAKGLNNNQIAGIMGNIQQESEFDTTATNDSSGAYGLFQWLGSRKTELQKYAKQKGTDVSDIMTQLEFSWNEMNSTESKTLSMLNENKYSSARTIAKLFEQTYERSGGSEITKRQDYASSWVDYFGGSDGVIGSKDNTLDNATNFLGETLSNDTINFSLTGNILKATTLLLLVVLAVVFLFLTLKNTALSGVSGMAKDLLKDTLKDVTKGGGKSE